MCRPAFYLPPREIAYQLEDSDAKAIFAFEGTDELPIGASSRKAFDMVDSCEHLIVMTKEPFGSVSIRRAQVAGETHRGRSRIRSKPYPTAPSDTCAILYTSGTTGQPKGAELTHLNLYSNVTTTYLIHLPMLDFTDGLQKTVLITLPLFHTTGQTVQMNTNVYGGNRIVLLPRFEPKATLDAMAKEKVNFWVGVPTMFWSLLKYADDTGYDISRIAENMKVCTSGGAPMPVEVMKEFRVEIRRPRYGRLRIVGDVAARDIQSFRAAVEAGYGRTGDIRR